MNKNKKMTFGEKQELISGFEIFGVELLQQSELFLFGDCDEWALGNIRQTLVNIVCMAADRYGITTDYAKKEREEFLKRIGHWNVREGGENDYLNKEQKKPCRIKK